MHNRTLLFGRTLLKHGRHFDYWNKTLNMRMHACYLYCHTAGLCCYLVIHTENLLHPFPPFYFHLWSNYWLSLVQKIHVIISQAMSLSPKRSSSTSLNHKCVCIPFCSICATPSKSSHHDAQMLGLIIVYSCSFRYRIFSRFAQPWTSVPRREYFIVMWRYMQLYAPDGFRNLDPSVRSV
jgi:hypothetical protein